MSDAELCALRDALQQTEGFTQMASVMADALDEANYLFESWLARLWADHVYFKRVTFRNGVLEVNARASVPIVYTDAPTASAYSCFLHWNWNRGVVPMVGWDCDRQDVTVRDVPAHVVYRCRDAARRAAAAIERRGAIVPYPFD